MEALLRLVIEVVQCDVSTQNGIHMHVVYVKVSDLLLRFDRLTDDEATVRVVCEIRHLIHRGRNQIDIELVLLSIWHIALFQSYSIVSLLLAHNSIQLCLLLKYRW